MNSPLFGVLFPFLPVLAALVAWLVGLMNTALNTDHAWLSIAAGRLLDGGRQLTDFYEPNPPLSILLYVPGVFLSRMTGVPVYYMPYVMGLAALTLSSLAVFFLLKKWSFLEEPALSVFMGSYILASTILASRIYFAERDEYVVWGLIPFLIAQLAITRSVCLPRGLVWSVLILGAVCILIKPHYGILPVILLFHRMRVRRRVSSILRDADFLALAGAVCLYALVIVVFFRDYINFILPDFLKLYIPLHRPEVLIDSLPKVAPLLFLMVAPRLFSLPENIRRVVLLCGLAAAISGGLFLLQGKGVYDHLIPAMVFFYCGLGMFLYSWGCPFPRSPRLGVFSTLAILSFFACAAAPLKADLLTHEEYKQLKLSRLAAEAGPHGTFLVFSEGMEMVHQASIYGGAVHASRFPNFWWLDGLLRGWESKDKIAMYSGYVAEDLRRYKPNVIADEVNIYRGDGKYLDLVSYFSQYPPFRDEMKHYRKEGRMVDNRRYYFRGTTLDFDWPIIYDIYRRVPDTK